VKRTLKRELYVRETARRNVMWFCSGLLIILDKVRYKVRCTLGLCSCYIRRNTFDCSGLFLDR
jgi:glutamine amidotransferase PdxT